MLKKKQGKKKQNINYTRALYNTRMEIKNKRRKNAGAYYIMYIVHSFSLERKFRGKSYSINAQRQIKIIF